MNSINIRLAENRDADSILKLFLKQFPFLQECEDKARKDVNYRITEDDSVTIVAEYKDQVVGVARGHKNKDIFLMDSICTLSSSSLAYRSKVLLAMLPFYVKTCISHAEKLGLTTAFFGSDVKSLVRLGSILCDLNGFSLTPGIHNEKNGFWVTKKKTIINEKDTLP